MTKRIYIYGFTVIPALIFTGVTLLFFPYYLKPNYAHDIMHDAENHSICIANHFIEAYSTDVLNFHYNDDGEFGKCIERDVKGFNLWKVRLFNADGVIIFSSNTTEIGNTNYKPYFRNIVSKGKVFSKVVQKESFTASGSLAPFDVVETYVPIMENGKFKGAYEVYLNVADQMNRIEHLFLNTYIVSVVIVCLFLLLVIVLSIIIDRNVCELHKARKETNSLKELPTDSENGAS